MTVLRRVPQWLISTTYAHRGLHTATVPENSLAAAERAIAAGYGIECDIQLSGDGTAFVFHDWDLVRMAGSGEKFDECTDAGLGPVRLLGTDQSPPSLKQFLQLVDGRVPVLVEIKSWPGYDVIRSCKRVCSDLDGYAGAIAIMSFDPRVSEWLAQSAPDICRGLVGTDSLPNGFENVWRHPKTIEQAQPDFLAIDRRDLARSEVASWRAAGKPVLSWTIKTATEREQALPLADALIAEGEALV